MRAARTNSRYVRDDKQKNKQRQPQVLRLRRSQTARTTALRMTPGFGVAPRMAGGWVMRSLRCACRPKSLGDEEEFAGGFAGFEVAMGLGGVGERVDVFEAEFEGAVGYCIEDVFGSG